MKSRWHPQSSQLLILRPLDPKIKNENTKHDRNNTIKDAIENPYNEDQCDDACLLYWFEEIRCGGEDENHANLQKEIFLQINRAVAY